MQPNKFLDNTKMRKFLLIGLLFVTSFGFSQLRISSDRNESFSVEALVDPSASIKEGGLNFGARLSYRGTIYTAIEVQAFPALTGGYNEIGGAIGLNYTLGDIDDIRLYTGLRGGFVSRANLGFVYAAVGFEGGVEHNISDHIFVGARASYVYRDDPRAFDWSPIWRFNAYLTIGYKWNWKKNNCEKD